MNGSPLAGALQGRSWIFFDLFGTLVHARPDSVEVYRQALNELGFTPSQAALDEAVHASLNAYWLRRWECRSEEAVRGVREEMAAALVARVAPEREPEERRALAGQIAPIFGRMRNWYALFDDVVPVLERLSVDGWRLGVISNWDATATSLLRELDVERFFQVKAISIPDGVEKPDPAIFRLALERAGASPEESVMVGDSYGDDIQPAHDLGFLAVHVTRRGRPGGRPDAGGLSVPGEAGAPPDGVVAISSLLELMPAPRP